MVSRVAPSPPAKIAAGRFARLLLALVCVALAGGCTVWPWRHEPPRPGRTTLDKRQTELPTQFLGNYLIVEAKWEKRRPARFIIDTGSSVTLVSAEFAASQGIKGPAGGVPAAHVRSADGTVATLPGTVLRRLKLGDALFESVPALVYDCSAISAHLGVQIDGILGFPLFRETILTLDYPHSRVLLAPRHSPALLPGSVVPFNNRQKTPLISVRLGDQSFVALIDSGSDAALHLNPLGLHPTFVRPPRTGVSVGTLTGDRTQQIGRVRERLVIGNYELVRPVVDLTDELSAIGGDILRHFTVTFDQERSQVTFYRESMEPIPPTPRLSSGLSFNKTPAYWRVATVVPDSPAAAAGAQTGDLITRINGEPVSAWPLGRYEELVADGGVIVFTFLNGRDEFQRRIPVFSLVP
ncbi:aspartyl protease family protein [Horticoccus luteus]|uniref:Aspartyl protease family protein n=1 Tax=Horticoccus luteus TaxID=2862869 RepID=A0A8F9XI11_9BACT|nr:aspartyl protease family protein [Horticoccus luteus]QYM79930.1 aspartyl protease family protein [Horticoccus luteus]